jgi:5-formyltetrahydrofolate cyclo-ligase
MKAVAGDKELMRQWLKSKRMKISNDDVDTLSLDINKSLIELLNWDSFKTIHCYESIESLKEVTTASLLDYLRERNKQIFIQDKSPNKPLPEVGFNLIIVPTLGFDGRGNRMGWGGGYYDRLLADQKGALKIGLCYQNGFVAGGIPAEPHDIPLDIVITNTKIYKFK